MTKEKARQKRYANRNAKEILFRVGDPVYMKNHTKKKKFEPHWRPYYRVIEQTSPLTFRLKNQLTGELVSSHAEHLRLAKADWPNLNVAKQTKTLRKTRLTVVPEQTEDEIASE
ncbi:hypothetical protein PoB_006687700 [Plakobranchus ocellatus]|uniref:Uncharacterized protein n=1 Tax=Plakobranchus ocellatus TaxID=259542 RepID=A0AAV4D8F1_9GAST|nr:hypothetical protein PoB_006687700 [Plakobranchus ocellatus]